MLHSLAGLEKLRAERPEVLDQCQAAAGLSLGEYTALVFAGALSVEDALKLVKIRAEAMQLASDNSDVSRRPEADGVVGVATGPGRCPRCSSFFLTPAPPHPLHRRA